MRRLLCRRYRLRYRRQIYRLLHQLLCRPSRKRVERDVSRDLGRGYRYSTLDTNSKTPFEKKGLGYRSERRSVVKPSAIFFRRESSGNIICAGFLQWRHGRCGGCHVLVYAAGYRGVWAVAQPSP